MTNSHQNEPPELLVKKKMISRKKLRTLVSKNLRLKLEIVELQISITMSTDLNDATVTAFHAAAKRNDVPALEAALRGAFAPALLLLLLQLAVCLLARSFVGLCALS